MKTKISILFFSFLFIAVCTFAQSKTDSIKVWGNCEMCKGKIEKAAKAAGASSAEWNEENKFLVVNYNESATTNMEIQKKVAAAGYDTQEVKATEEAYKKLEKCCEYKRPQQ